MASEKSDRLLAEWFWSDRWDGSSAASKPIAVRGLYREMLTQAWRREARLPNDEEEIQRICRVTSREWRECWPHVKPYWRATGERGEWLINDTQIEIYREAVERFQRAQGRAHAGAQASARARAQGRAHAGAYAGAQAPTYAAAHGEPSVSVSVSVSDQDLSERGGVVVPPRASGRSDGVLAGHLPRDHRDHAACSPNYAICVPAAVHSRLRADLAPKYGGDADQADKALQAWYREVWASLPPDTVRGDAFRFWLSRFDTRFASPAPPAGKPSPASNIPDAEETRRRYLS